MSRAAKRMHQYLTGGPLLTMQAGQWMKKWCFGSKRLSGNNSLKYAWWSSIRRIKKSLTVLAWYTMSNHQEEIP